MLPKIFIVGAGGMVGSVTAYCLLVKELVNEIILIDIDEERLQGQYLDLFHASSITRKTFIRKGDYSEIEENDIVIITAGTAQKIGQTRLDLLAVNSKIVEDITKKVLNQGNNVFLIVVSNPVDVLTYITYKVSGLDKSRVFGSGTCTDTARLNAYIAEKFKVPHREVECYVLGEHGESAFACFSMSTVRGERIIDLPEFQQINYDEVNDYLRKAAYTIIESKGSTYYGIASSVGEIVDSLVNNKNKLLTTCSIAEGEYDLNNLAIGLPNRITESGSKIDTTFALEEKEMQLLRSSSEVLLQAIKESGF